MVLLEINLVGVTVGKLESNTPWTVYMNGVACRPERLQSMKLRTSEVHIVRLFGLIETVQQAQDPALQALVDPASPAIAP